MRVIATNEEFKKSKIDGKLGERVVFDYLNSKVKEIMNVTKDTRYFQEEDVDFIVKYYDGNIYKIEVKTDFKAHETGNIYYEVNSYTTKGCFARTKADLVMYYIPKTYTLLQIDVPKIRSYIEENKENLKLTNAGTFETGVSSGYLLKINELKDKGILKEIKEVY